MPVGPFLLFSHPLRALHHILKMNMDVKLSWMEQKGDKKSKREEKDGRYEGRKGKKTAR